MSRGQEAGRVAPGTDREERALLDSLFEGDRRAGEALVDRSYEMIYASLHRLVGGDAELAADLTQETYRKAWRSLSSFRGGSRFSTWLYRIAYNTFLNHVRRPVLFESGAQEEEGGQPQPVDPAPDQEEVLASREMSERLRRAVLALPEEVRFTITARFWGELPVREIARLEGITTVAIRKRLRKGMSALRLVLEEER